jgi:hypothetical protein
MIGGQHGGDGQQEGAAKDGQQDEKTPVSIRRGIVHARTPFVQRHFQERQRDQGNRVPFQRRRKIENCFLRNIAKLISLPGLRS